MNPNRICQFAVACALALVAALPARSQTLADLRNDQATPGDVLTYGMGYANQRYSALKGINKGNLAKLVPVWNYTSTTRRAKSHSRSSSTA